MSQNKMTIYAPQLPAPETMADPRFTIRDVSQNALVTYCPRNHVGAVYHIEPGMWRIYCPIYLQSFLGALADNIELPDGADLHSWLDAISAGAVPKDRGKAN